MENSNFEIVRQQIKTAYHAIENQMPEEWSLPDCTSLFEYYFQQYQMVFKREHPHMRTQTIQQIIAALPAIEDQYGREFDLDPNDYPALIADYFEHDFGRCCNYSMAHFISGDIRLMRCYDLYLI